jgi:Anticodon-binding domain of tRNA ligase
MWKHHFVDGFDSFHCVLRHIISSDKLQHTVTRPCHTRVLISFLLHLTSSQASRRVLVYVWDTCLRLLHPFMPFLTEALWQLIPHTGESIMIADWPQLEDSAPLPVDPNSGVHSLPFSSLHFVWLYGSICALFTAVGRVAIHRAPSVFRNTIVKLSFLSRSPLPLVLRRHNFGPKKLKRQLLLLCPQNYHTHTHTYTQSHTPTLNHTHSITHTHTHPQRPVSRVCKV